MKYLYYVVMRRWYQSEEIISIYDFNEAVKGNWIDKDGNRVWVVPAEEEKSITFVWGFNDLDMAVSFHEALRNNELGIRCGES